MSMPQPLLTFAATPGMSSGSRGSTDPTHGPTARIDPRPPELATGGRVPARCDVREGHTSSLRKPSDIDACSGPGLRPSARYLLGSPDGRGSGHQARHDLLPLS